MASTSAALALSAKARPGVLTVPPLVHAPLPVVPVSVKVVGPVTVMRKVPLAAVLPTTPAMVTCIPVSSPLAMEVVIWIGEALEAAVTVNVGPLMAVSMSGGGVWGGSHWG